MQRGIYLKWCTGIFLAPLSLALFSCESLHNSTPDQDELLFRRGIRALEQGRSDIAALEFQTLVNTFPTSKYALRSKRLLRYDPRRDCHELAKSTFTPIVPCDEGS